MALELRYGARDVRVLEDSTVWSGHYAMRRLTLQHRRFAGDWSQPIVREVFERGDAVGVLPYEPASDTLVMIEQFRPGALRGNDSPWMLELIAGVVEPGESDEAVIHREAMEEAGLRGRCVGAPLGCWEMLKYDEPYTLVLLLMEVTDCADDWDEAHLRERRWVGVDEARRLLCQPQLRKALDTAFKRLRVIKKPTRQKRSLKEERLVVQKAKSGAKTRRAAKRA